MYHTAHSADHTRPYPGIVPLLAHLHDAGVRMAVYSNKADDFSCALIDRFFPGIFQLVRGKREGTPVKPDAQAARAVLAELGAAPELRTTLSHELTHHMEQRSGLHALDDRDAEELAAWRQEYESGDSTR